ncbi:MAG: hypothetical protein HOP35_00840 [Nitrospira sp.]|nr:hypothetical protein [Nitrospira sp.]
MARIPSTVLSRSRRRVCRPACPPLLTGGQSATLTLNSGTAPTGLATLTIFATAVIEGQTMVRQSPLQVNVLAA